MGVYQFCIKIEKGAPTPLAGLRPRTPPAPFFSSINFGLKLQMDRHLERLTKFRQTGERLLPPPPMLDLDPIIPPYQKFGEMGHLYIVKPPGQEPDEFIFKVGSTTQLLKRMYWYEQGTELLFSILVQNSLRSMEGRWIKELKKDERFTLVRGKEYFSGNWEEAVKILHSL